MISNSFNSQWSKFQHKEFISFLKQMGFETQNIDLSVFEMAFTHPSYAYENHLDYNYQKLEFYGDAIIEKEVSQYLFNLHDLNEGQMSSDRKKMVCHNTLCKIAKDLKFERFILIGTSYNSLEISEKNYEDIYEAFCAALYITLGEQALSCFVNKTIIYYYENDLLVNVTDYKTKFQETMQRYGKQNIKYVCEMISDEEQKNISFVAKVMCDGILYGTGMGHKKQEAESNAAKDALNKHVK